MVVVQSQENGKVNAKVIRQAYSEAITHNSHTGRDNDESDS